MILSSNLFSPLRIPSSSTATAAQFFSLYRQTSVHHSNLPLIQVTGFHHKSALQYQRKQAKRHPGFWTLSNRLRTKSRTSLYRRLGIVKTLLSKPWTRLNSSSKKHRIMSQFYSSNSDDVGAKAKSAFSSFKNKATNYMNTIATKNANNSYGREISRLISAGSIASTPGPPGSNLVNPPSIPSDDEILMVYPSYCRQREDGKYEVDVRGWLYLPGQPNRKSRMVVATAKRIAGVKSDTYPHPYTDPSRVNSTASFQGSVNAPLPSSQKANAPEDENLISLSDEEDADIKNLKTEFLDSQSTTTQHKPSPPPPPSRTYSSTSSIATNHSFSQEETLKARLAPFLTRPVAFRTIDITFSGLTDEHGESMKVFHAETNNAGRFSTRITLDNKPSIVSVQAHDKLVTFEEVIDVEPEGISIISDIDDTIKDTGILGNKRELFRNVFVRDYEKIAIEGVQRWYQDLQQMGVKFHYVSNSPWQLYPTIFEYLRSSRLPRGSMHLKEYSGFLNGLFEPASERKRMNLYGILKDFPRRKFILIGDSGEGDLEAYIDVARRFPDQILAIYIRDVTLPPGDKTAELLDEELLTIKSRSVRQTASQASPADSSHNHNGSQVSLLDTIEPSSKPPPPKPRSFSTPLVQPAAPKSRTPTPDTATAANGRLPPPVPRKPTKLMVNPTKPKVADAPPLPPRPVFSTKPSEANAFAPPPDPIGYHPPSDPAGYPPPPPLPRRENIGSQVSSRTASPAPSNSSHPVMIPSSQDDYEFNDVLDKRVETWMSRLRSARYELSENIHLRMWRVGSDARAESLEVIKQAKSSLK